MPNTDIAAVERRRLERRALTISTIGYSVLGVLGVVFAALTGSDAILLDGVYSLVSVLLALVSARVARIVERPDSAQFHFGYATFEPLLNTCRVMTVLGIDAFALFAAIEALLAGGRPLQTGLAIVYGVVSAGASLAMSLSQHRLSRRVRSPLLAVDARNWFVDGMVSTSVALAFALALVLEASGAAAWVPYVDPLLVVILVLATLPVPLRALLENLPQLMLAAPRPDVQDRVRRVVHAELADHPGEAVAVRMLEIGRFFYVLVHVLVDESVSGPDVGESDARREAIRAGLREMGLRGDVDIVFTRNRRDALDP